MKPNSTLPDMFFSFSRSMRLGAALLATVFGGALLFGAEKAANDLAIRMSPYEVSANSIDFKRWIKVSSPNYIIYTDAKEKDALALIREFELLHRGAQTFLRRKVQNLPPTHVVLPTSNSDWKKIRNKGSVEWTAAVSAPASTFARLILVEYDWQNHATDMVHAVQGQGLAYAMNIEAPLWFYNGIGSFFETAEFKGDSIELGRQNTRTLALTQEGYLPWQRLFEITRDSKEYRKEWEVDKVFAQAAGFVQYMLAHPDPVWKERLIEWAALMAADAAPSEAEFKRVFGYDYKGWQKEMETYHRGGKYNVTTVRVPPQAMQFTPVRIDLPVTEMRELFILSQVLNQRIPDSEASLTSLLARGLKTESLRELLAEACLNWKLKDQGMEELRKLEAAGSLNPAVHAGIAVQLCYQRVPKITIHTRFEAETAAAILAAANRALSIEPRHKRASNFYVWSQALAATVDPAAIERLEAHYKFMVNHVATSDILSALAVAHWRLGQPERARVVAETLCDSPFADKEAKEIARDLLEALRLPFAAP